MATRLDIPLGRAAFDEIDRPGDAVAVNSKSNTSMLAAMGRAARKLWHTFWLIGQRLVDNLRGWGGALEK